MLDPDKISFRKIQTEDLTIMHKWLNEPHVHEWYDKDKENSLKEVIKRYGTRVGMRLFISTFLGLGYI
jgi:hypothetical protein